MVSGAAPSGSNPIGFSLTDLPCPARRRHLAGLVPAKGGVIGHVLHVGPLQHEEDHDDLQKWRHIFWQHIDGAHVLAAFIGARDVVPSMARREHVGNLRAACSVERAEQTSQGSFGCGSVVATCLRRRFKSTEVRRNR